MARAGSFGQEKKTRGKRAKPKGKRITKREQDYLVGGNGEESF
jgi:hypothetical protein